MFSLDSMSNHLPESLGGLGACAEVGLRLLWQVWCGEAERRRVRRAAS